MGSDLEGIVRRGTEAFNARDREAWFEVIDPDIVNAPPRDWPEPKPVHGREAVWDFWIDGTEPWELGTFELVELTELGDDRAVAHIRAEVSGRASGAAVLWSFWQLLAIRGGKVARIDWFAEREAALDAAGIASVDEPHL